jgi:hypothetical protein
MDVIPVGPSADFEVLIGVMAVTTFLVGFSTVRMQASLQEWRERGERITSRLLEQNAGEDLLPLPTTLQNLTGVTQKLKIDVVTWLTLLATLVSFIAFDYLHSEIAFLVGLYGDETFLTYLNWLFFLITFIAVADVIAVKYKAWKELRRTPLRIYSLLEVELLKWSRQTYSSSQEPAAKLVGSGFTLQRCDDFDRVIPDWCWISLIRYDVQRYYQDWPTQYWKAHAGPVQVNGLDVAFHPPWRKLIFFLLALPDDTEINFNLKPLIAQMMRLRRTAEKFKSDDDYSLIAYVWSSFLLDDDAGVSEQDLVKVNDFRLLTDDTFAELALRCAARTLVAKVDVDDARLTTIANFKLPSHTEPTRLQLIVRRILYVFREYPYFGKKLPPWPRK